MRTVVPLRREKNGLNEAFDAKTKYPKLLMITSMKEMILKPRQSPKRPPRDEKKSFHVILALLSISKQKSLL